MKKGVMMQGFEWYLPASPHLWKILRINAYKLIKVYLASMIQDMVFMITMT